MIRRCSIDAKAKINLGLEILGKRDDGFHDICSILAMVDLSDQLEFTYSPGTRGRLMIEPTGLDIDPEVNLVTAAISSFNNAAGTDCFPKVVLTKQIPVAAGLGGASSDCAATLLAMNHLTRNPMTRAQLIQIAASLGSDIPFFLGSPVAWVTGRGTDVHDLPPIANNYVVIMTPNISIPSKTSTLYKTLQPEDFSDGSSVCQQVERLTCGRDIDPALLGNTFESALARVSPASVEFHTSLGQFGDVPSWLSGAGPSRYLLPQTEEDSSLIGRLHTLPILGIRSINTAAFASSGLEVRE